MNTNLDICIGGILCGILAGRQDDKQGEYTDLHGNWLTGINFIDDVRLGPQEFIPSDAIDNKARNTYYYVAS